MKDHALQLVRRAPPGQGKNVLREYLQARILETLQRQGATGALVFCGGTALRFLYDLPRYSEDLDFTLEGDVSSYSPRRWLKEMERQLEREGYQPDVSLRQRTALHGGWIQFTGLLWEAGLSGQPSQKLRIKVDVDTNPPLGAVTETGVSRRHTAVRLRHHDRASLLAGKLAAILSRPYAKGRDLYDLAWYLADRRWPPPNLGLLNAALHRTTPGMAPLTAETWRSAVERRVEELPWGRVTADALPFLEDARTMLTREETLALLRSA